MNFNLDRAIVDVVQSVCTSVLDLEIERATCAVPPFRRAFAGCVQIVGAWSGAVLLWCDDGFANTCASILFNAEVCSEAETRDALGELTNMVAGNLKSLLPAPSQLSLPTVASGAELTLAVPDSRELENVEFQLASGHRLTVVVLASCDRSSTVATPDRGCPVDTTHDMLPDARKAPSW